MFMTIAIGDKFVYHNKTLVVVESNGGSCQGCFFNKGKGGCRKNIVASPCSSEGRSDKTDVIFKLWNGK